MRLPCAFLGLPWRDGTSDPGKESQKNHGRLQQSALLMDTNVLVYFRPPIVNGGIARMPKQDVEVHSNWEKHFTNFEHFKQLNTIPSGTSTRKQTNSWPLIFCFAESAGDQAFAGLDFPYPEPLMWEYRELGGLIPAFFEATARKVTKGWYHSTVVRVTVFQTFLYGACHLTNIP